jgi:hypothetical protein
MVKPFDVAGAMTEKVELVVTSVVPLNTLNVPPELVSVYPVPSLAVVVVNVSLVNKPETALVPAAPDGKLVVADHVTEDVADVRLSEYTCLTTYKVCPAVGVPGTRVQLLRVAGAVNCPVDHVYVDVPLG